MNGSGRRAILLDVDGVLCPYGGPSTEWAEWTVAPDTGDLVVSLRMAAALDELAADVYWLTSWEDRANHVICPIVGWPPLTAFRAPRTSRAWWKLSRAREFLTSTTYDRVAWVDDELASYVDEVEEAVGGELASGRLATLCPESSIGLTRDHLNELRHHFSTTWA